MDALMLLLISLGSIVMAIFSFERNFFLCIFYIVLAFVLFIIGLIVLFRKKSKWKRTYKKVRIGMSTNEMLKLMDCNNYFKSFYSGNRVVYTWRTKSSGYVYNGTGFYEEGSSLKITTKNDVVTEIIANL